MTPHYTIAVLAGDGIGPEVMEATLRVLRALEAKGGVRFAFQEALVGGAAFDRYGVHLPDETLRVCEHSDGILFGSVGGPLTERHHPRWRGCEKNSILALRNHFRFGVNLRPIQVLPELQELSPLREELTRRGIDILFVRELLGDLYFGRRTRSGLPADRSASDSGSYHETLIANAVHTAFRAAHTRSKKVCLVHKANVLAMSELWVEVGREIALTYPDIEYYELLVDNCAMQLVRDPSSFDIIVTSNLFGDILSDLGAALTGSLGLCPSASINDKGFGLYEPAGGSAPDIAGKGVANPTAQILSAAMLLEYSLGQRELAGKIRDGVKAICATPHLRTRDLGGSCSTESYTEALVHYLNDFRG